MSLSLLASVLAVCFLAGPALAWGLGGSDGGLGGSGGSSGVIDFGSGSEGPGCCISVPPELEEEYAELEKSFLATEIEELRRQNHAKSLCANHPCGEGILEDDAREFLRDLAAAIQRKEDWEATHRANDLAWIAAVFSGVGIVLAVIGLWQTHLANKIAREASERSIRTEEQMSHIKESIS